MNVNQMRLFQNNFFVGFFFLVCCVTLNGQSEIPGTRAQYDAMYQERIKKTHLHGAYIPLDLTDAFVELKKRIETKDLEAFKNMPEQTATLRLHYSFGRWIIHNWGFYGGSRLSHYIKQFGITHPDDMAQLILSAFHRSLNSKPIELKELVSFYKDKRKAIALQKKPHLKAILEHNNKVAAQQKKEEEGDKKN